MPRTTEQQKRFNATRRAKYAVNPEPFKIAVAAYRAANPEKILETNQRYRPTGSAEMSYAGMIQRCHNPKSKKYPDYGGRGIKVCKRWLGKNGRNKFLSDMGPRLKGTTLDRKNVNGHYCPNNCKWSNSIEQIDNRRSTPLSGYKGVTRTSSGNYSARIHIPLTQKTKYLGSRSTPEEAHDLFCAEHKRIHGELSPCA